MTTVAVVGGTGVIGRVVVRALQDADRDVVVVSHRRSVSGSVTRYGDLLHAETLGPAIAGADVVIQTANFPNYPMERPRRGWTFAEFDFRGTQRLVVAAQRAGVRRFVFISGAGVHRSLPTGAPRRPYFQALAGGEQAVMDSGMEAACIEPTVVVTPTDNGLNRILRVARRVPMVLPVPGGDQIHQPLWGDDLARMVVQASELGAPEGVFELGGPQRMPLTQMLRTLLEVAGLRRRLLTVPLWVPRAVGSIAELMPGGLLTREGAVFLGEDFVADNTAALSTFDLRLHDLESTLRGYVGRAA